MDTSEYKPTGDVSNSRYSDNSNNMGVGIGIKSEWEITLKDARTGEIKQQIPWHKNMILDVGLNYILTMTRGFTYYFMYSDPTYMPFAYIAVGSGNTAPAATDVGLQTQVLRKVASYSDSVILNETDHAAPYCVLGTTFTESQANGDLKEVGLVSAAAGGTFLNRDLFKDGGGNPVTITKTSNDLLTVKCKITVKRTSEAPSSYNITASDSTVHAIKGIVTNAGLKCLIDAGDVWGSSRALWSGTSNADPAPTDDDIKQNRIISSLNATFGAAHNGPTGGFYRDVALIANPGDCNQNIAEVTCGGYNIPFQSRFTFNPVLVKTSAKKLTLSMRVMLSRL